jgi:hypothetical protein
MATASTVTTNTSQFGMCVDDTGITGTGVAIPAPYNDTVNNCHNLAETGTDAATGTSLSSTYAFNDSSTASNGTNYTGGSSILTSTGPVSSSYGYMTFMGNIAATTVAGTYTANINLVATGTF